MTTIKIASDPAAPWYWEGNVQAAVARFLQNDGWQIERIANTALRERGIDLIATKEGQRLAVEVKGFPGTVYARGPKAGQPKPTPPTLQAKHWLGGALLSAILIAESEPDTEVALAFPDMPRYRALLARVATACERLRLRVFLVSEDETVAEFARNV
jgi:hypothetical protein